MWPRPEQCGLGLVPHLRQGPACGGGGLQRARGRTPRGVPGPAWERAASAAGAPSSEACEHPVWGALVSTFLPRGCLWGQRKGTLCLCLLSVAAPPGLPDTWPPAPPRLPSPPVPPVPTPRLRPVFWAFARPASRVGLIILLFLLLRPHCLFFREAFRGLPESTALAALLPPCWDSCCPVSSMRAGTHWPWPVPVPGRGRSRRECELSELTRGGGALRSAHSHQEAGLGRGRGRGWAPPGPGPG